MNISLLHQTDPLYATLTWTEVVPFRLTANLIDAFGPTGVEGVFTESLKDAMMTLRSNRDTLLSVLEPFVNDPVILWKRKLNEQQQHVTGENIQVQEAKRSLNTIDERLKGIYNLKNPNFSRIRRTDSSGGQEEDEMDLAMPHSVEGQIHKLIEEATSSQNLVQLYFGWMSWV